MCEKKITNTNVLGSATRSFLVGRAHGRGRLYRFSVMEIVDSYALLKDFKASTKWGERQRSDPSLRRYGDHTVNV